MNTFVMVIDDSLIIRKILEVCLHRAGYQVKTFSDAVEVFNWLRTPEAFIPALVFMDIGLPRLNGYTLIQRLKARPVFAQTAFVILSGRNGVLDKLKGRLVGANAYLTKPFKTHEVITVAHTYLGTPISCQS